MLAAIPFPDISPEIFSIEIGGFAFALRWYALAYIVGILIGWRLAVRALKRPALWHPAPAMTPAQMDDLLTWIVLGIIVGGRLGFVLFYQPAYYLANPLDIPKIWQGGMAFHGGMLGVALALVVYARRHGLVLGSVADTLALGTPPALLLGRVANFINAELWGRPTDLPWGVIFPGPLAQDCPDAEGPCARHPSQLYEAGLEGLVLGGVLIWLAFAAGWLKRPWALTGTFLAGYGAARIFVEFFRQADPQYIAPDNPGGHVVRLGEAGLTMGQVLSLPMLLAGLALLAFAWRRGMTPLAALLLRQIEATGPITVADYMAACLMHPDHGYYATRDPFGAAGDFTTAPEISQMFGELLGLCLAQAWLDQGRHAPVTLAELGPGRGTLMADALRATRGVPGFAAAAQIHLVEASPTLRAAQQKTLEPTPAVWLDSAAQLPDAPLFLIANEFFDALPVRQFQRDAAGWRERQVGTADGRLAFGLSAPAPLAALAGRLAGTAPGDIVETRPAAGPIMEELAARIARHGGAALIVDYGGWNGVGDTLQAVRGHRPEDPLAHPGEADLTAHVDFAALAEAARGTDGFAHTPMTPQGVFLERLGITRRARALAAKLDGAALDAHIAAHRRLTHPDEMGSLFQAMALYPKTAPPPPGFGP